MHHPAAAEISVEAEGLRLTLRVESSLEDYSRQAAAPLPDPEVSEFANLVHQALPAAHPALLQARDLVVASLSQSYTALLIKQTDSLLRQQRADRLLRKQQHTPRRKRAR